MKTFDAGLGGHYALRTTTVATFLELTRRDNVVVRYTGADFDVVLDAQTWTTAQGLKASNLAVSSGAAVDSAELQIFPDGDDMLEADLLAGLWDFAAFRLFEANYLDPAGGINVLRRGWTGVAQAARTYYTIELRSLKQAWQQSVGAVTSKNCRSRLGDDRCLVDLGPFTHTYATTAVASKGVFTCAAATEVDDFYGDGIVTGLTGANAGYSQKVKTFAAGVFILSLSMPFPVGVGDTFSCVAGCRHRLIEDCKTKFDNVPNFQGEPHVPGADLLTADPEVGGA